MRRTKFTPEFLAVLAKHSSGGDLSPEEKSRIVSEYLASKEGREKLIEAMARPLRGPRDYVDCPVCGQSVAKSELKEHAASVGDEGHAVLEVMES